MKATLALVLFFILSYNAVAHDENEIGEIQFSYNIFGTPWLRNSLYESDDDQVISWSLYDRDNNIRDMHLLWDGTLDIPGALRLDHQETPQWGEYIFEYKTDIFGNPSVNFRPSKQPHPPNLSLTITVTDGEGNPVLYQFTAQGIVMEPSI